MGNENDNTCMRTSDLKSGKGSSGQQTHPQTHFVENYSLGVVAQQSSEVDVDLSGVAAESACCDFLSRVGQKKAADFISETIGDLFERGVEGTVVHDEV